MNTRFFGEADIEPWKYDLTYMDKLILLQLCNVGENNIPTFRILFFIFQIMLLMNII